MATLVIDVEVAQCNSCSAVICETCLEKDVRNYFEGRSNRGPVCVCRKSASSALHRLRCTLCFNDQPFTDLTDHYRVQILLDKLRRDNELTQAAVRRTCPKVPTPISAVLIDILVKLTDLASQGCRLAAAEVPSTLNHPSDRGVSQSSIRCPHHRRTFCVHHKVWLWFGKCGRCEQSLKESLSAIPLGPPNGLQVKRCPGKHARREIHGPHEAYHVPSHFQGVARSWIGSQAASA